MYLSHKHGKIKCFLVNFGTKGMRNSKKMSILSHFSGHLGTKDIKLCLSCE